MNIKHRKIILIVILILSNMITIAGFIQLNRNHGEYDGIFRVCGIISFSILSFVSVVYILHYIIVKIARAKLENYRIKNSYFSMVIQQKQDILFQWNKNKDTIIYSANVYKKYAIEMVRKNFIKSIVNSENILDKHKVILLEAINKFIDGSTYEQIEVKLKKIDGDYSWVRVSCTAILNSYGKLSKIVGVITDIEDEKRKNEELTYKAERDSLTQVYNRGKFIELVDDYLNGIGKNKKSYLVMIDVDDFKIINDSLGHIYGDKALINLTNSLTNILNKYEFIGRLGGDELCIFIEGSYEKSDILKRADEIMNTIINTYVGEGKKINISASIGIAQYPKHGVNFKELYIKSDKAMYKAKKNGKGRYIIYDED